MRRILVLLFSSIFVLSILATPTGVYLRPKIGDIDDGGRKLGTLNDPLSCPNILFYEIKEIPLHSIN